MDRTLHKIQGGKFRLLPDISHTLSKVEFNKDSVWVEPFFGTGVVGLNLAPENAFFYDINPHIINFYRDIKSGALKLDEFIKRLNFHRLQFSLYGERHYYQMRSDFNSNPNAFDFFILNRTGFNGLVRFNKSRKELNTPYCRDDIKLTETLVFNLSKIFEDVSYKIKHNNWHFKVKAFKSSIAFHSKNEKSLFFCDPPYLGRNTQYFTDWTIDDEAALYKALSSQKGRFLLTTWFGEYDLPSTESKNGHDNVMNELSDASASTNSSFANFWNKFERDIIKHKYCVAGASKRVGIYEAIVYK